MTIEDEPISLPLKLGDWNELFIVLGSNTEDPCFLIVDSKESYIIHEYATKRVVTSECMRALLVERNIGVDTKKIALTLSESIKF